jgi:hypothetical protein
VNAEFWLTHTSPSGTEHVLHHVMDLPEAGGRFAFAPTSVATSRGDVQVEMSGVIDRFRSPAGGEFFVISMNRLLTGASLPPGGISGSTGAVTSMPGPDEVLLLDVSGRGAGARGGGRGGGGAVGSGGQMRSGGGGGGWRSAAPAGAATPAQLTSLLEGHQFALRLRITEKE